MTSEALNFDSLVAAIERTHSALAEQASKAVNLSLTLRNWFIGYYIAEFELQGADRASYGDKLLTELSRALRDQSVSNTGRRQLYGYLAFYRTYPQIVRAASALSAQVVPPFLLEEKVRTLSAQFPDAPALDGEKLINRLSYSHFEQLVELEAPLQRRFYEAEALRGNWSVRELKRQIASLYYERSGLSKNKTKLSATAHAKAETLQPAQIIRDPYIFEFLGLRSQDTMGESDLEDALLERLQEFLLEMGHGFCFEARQKRILIGGEYFFVDLVFYHRILKCHILVELKTQAFSHENLGQLNTYVAYYKKHEMTAGDQPPVGILLCTRKNQALVEFALGDMPNSLFVSNYAVEMPDKAAMENFLKQLEKEIGHDE
ncbi:MAG: PDDEXK nuclease domain-containing protein [Rhodocyclaceae bacterium]|nr:PDDEXK nuclease domain-containing protein [Rhodocyclaceae bacterium]